ncbi:MAG TPA: DUF3857 domain-containing protein [Bacteroidia bacterium]|jgi:hypothetical protein|nr:DUF3857 domain-containing protein [Bacteroidia bacterium]
MFTCSLKKSILFINIFFYAYSIAAHPKVASDLRNPDHTYTLSDSMAGIVILNEQGFVDFPNTSGMSYHYTIQFKVLKDTVLRGDFITIPYEVRDNIVKERIYEVNAFVYAIEHNVLKKINIPKENISERHIQGIRFEKVIKVPNLKSGSILEYSYKKQTPFTIRTDPEVWYFQKSLPVKSSEYSLLIPSYLSYENKGNGTDYYYENVKADTTTTTVIGLPTKAVFYRFVMHNLPPNPKDDGILGPDCTYKEKFVLRNSFYPHKPTRAFNLLTSVDSALKDEFKSFELYNSSYQRAYKEFDGYRNRPNDQNKLKDIFVKVFLTEHPLSDLLSKQQANLTLTKALTEAGFDCHPVFLNIYENIDTSFVTARDFNYQISGVNVNGKMIYIDAVDSLTLRGLLPNFLIHKSGRLISADSSKWVEIDSDRKILHLENLTAEISNAGVINASYFSTKNEYAVDTTKFTPLLRSLSDIQYTEVRSENNTEAIENKKSYNFRFQCIINNGDIYLYPIIPLQFIDDQLKGLSSDCALDWKINIDHSYTASFKLPSEYYVSGAPTSEVITLINGDAKFSYLLTRKDNYLNLVCRLTTYRTKFLKSDYAQVRSFYDQIMSKQNAMVVLKKEK